MPATINLDDDLLAMACGLTGIICYTPLMRKTRKVTIARESAQDKNGVFLPVL